MPEWFLVWMGVVAPGLVVAVVVVVLADRAASREWARYEAVRERRRRGDYS